MARYYHNTGSSGRKHGFLSVRPTFGRTGIVVLVVDEPDSLNARASKDIILDLEQIADLRDLLSKFLEEHASPAYTEKPKIEGKF